MSLPHSSRLGFLTPALLFVAEQVLMVRQCLVPCRMFSSIRGFYPLDDSGMFLQGQSKISPDILGGQPWPRIENQCPRSPLSHFNVTVDSILRT